MQYGETFWLWRTEEVFYVDSEGRRGCLETKDKVGVFTNLTVGHQSTSRTHGLILMKTTCISIWCHQHRGTVSQSVSGSRACALEFSPLSLPFFLLSFLSSLPPSFLFLSLFPLILERSCPQWGHGEQI